MEMKWIFSDAVNLALDMYKAGEIPFEDLDKTVAELWEEMQALNAND